MLSEETKESLKVVGKILMMYAVILGVSYIIFIA